jgi:hypothetical protein
MEVCVACGRKYRGKDHHCDPAYENRVQALDRGHYAFRDDRTPDFTERLTNGFLMMELTEHEGE